MQTVGREASGCGPYPDASFSSPARRNRRTFPRSWDAYSPRSRLSSGRYVYPRSGTPERARADVRPTECRRSIPRILGAGSLEGMPPKRRRLAGRALFFWFFLLGGLLGAALEAASVPQPWRSLLVLAVLAVFVPLIRAAVLGTRQLRRRERAAPVPCHPQIADLRGRHHGRALGHLWCRGRHEPRPAGVPAAANRGYGMARLSGAPLETPDVNADWQWQRGRNGARFSAI